MSKCGWEVAAVLFFLVLIIGGVSAIFQQKVTIGQAMIIASMVPLIPLLVKGVRSLCRQEAVVVPI